MKGMVRSMIASVNGSYKAPLHQQGIDRSTRTTGSFLHEAEQVKALSAEEEMAAFKRDFYAEIANIKIHSTVKNVAINVSEDGFLRMKDDPKYKEEILGLLRRDLCAPFIHPVSSLITIGGSKNEYCATAWSATADDDFWARSKNSHFIKKTSVRDDENDYARYWADMAAERHLLAYRHQVDMQNGEAIEKKLEEAQFEQSMLRKKATVS